MGTFASSLGSSVVAAVALWLSALPARAADENAHAIISRHRLGLTATDPENKEASSAERRRLGEEGRKYWESMRQPDSKTESLWREFDVGPITARALGNAQRLLVLAKAFALPDTGLKGDPALRSSLLAGIDWFYITLYNERRPEAYNWWEWEIGIPLAVLDLATLLEPDLGPERIDRLMAAIAHFSPDAGHLNYLPTAHVVPATGANLVWKCKVTILRDAFQNDPASLAAARAALEPVFAISQHGDGFHADGSFIQHEYFPYAGGYGMALISDITSLASLLARTSWQLDPAQVAQISDWLEHAYLPFVYRGSMMDAVRGREISRSYTTSASVGQKLLRICAQSGSWEAAADAIRLQGLARADHAAADMHVSFPEMDRVVHRTAGWAACLAMYSQRTQNYESWRKLENVRAWHTGDGMLYIYTTDPDQFDGDYWPTVEAHRLPGTTVIARQENPSNRFNGSDLVGSLTSADGRSGCAAMLLAPLGSALRAKKAWFFLGPAIVCLGSDVHAEGGQPPETIVENRRIDVRTRPALYIDNAAAEVSATPSERMAHYIHLGGDDGAGIGYYFPEPASLYFQHETREGRWTEINQREITDPRPCRNEFVSFWFNHGTAPEPKHYAYALIPGATRHETETFTQKPSFRVLQNTPEAQIVVTADSMTLAAALWAPSSPRAGSDERALAASAPVLCIVETAADSRDISLGCLDVAKPEAVTLEAGFAATSVPEHDPDLEVLALAPRLRLRWQPSQNKTSAHLRVTVAPAH